MTEQIRPVGDEDIWNFEVEIRGQMDEKDLHVMSPFQFVVTEKDASSMMFNIQTDQSGLIGMIRHLHNRGIALLSINREK